MGEGVPRAGPAERTGDYARFRARFLPSGGQRVSGRQARMMDPTLPRYLAGLFRAGRVYGNPQDFFGKRNFALLVVGYRSLFGIVRENFSPSPGRLPLSPAHLAGFFWFSASLRIQQTFIKGSIKLVATGFLPHPAMSLSRPA